MGLIRKGQRAGEIIDRKGFLRLRQEVLDGEERVPLFPGQLLLVHAGRELFGQFDLPDRLLPPSVVLLPGGIRG